MKTCKTIIPTLGLMALWSFCPPAAHANWLALDGENTIWLLADGNGAVINQFASLSPYHQSWTAMTLGSGGNVYVSTVSDTHSEQVQILASTGGQCSAITVGPYDDGGMISPGCLTFGPNGNLYIADAYEDSIACYNGTNGAFIGTFVTNSRANNLTFGPDGNLYVADASLGVARYNGTNGAYIDTFVPLGAKGVPDAANLVFGPDKNLYVCSTTSNAVFRFNGDTGQFMGCFVTPGSGGLSSPDWMAFGPDGNLYVASVSGAILRYNGQTGAFISAFGSHAQLGLIHIPDAAPPQLTIQSAGNNLVQISWPGGAGDSWTLYCQHGLSATQTWAIVTNAPVLVGTKYVVTDCCTSPAAYYRLVNK